MGSTNAPRTKTGCWTCRARKIKCDEARPQCKNCRPRNRCCQYGARPRAKRRRPATVRPVESLIAPVDHRPSPPVHPVAASTETDLPYGIQSTDWPFTLTEVDRRALQHYVDHVVPRMVLKALRWSTYSYVLFMCVQHPMLAHLLLAFSIRDMTERNSGEMMTAALEHYQEALTLFIWHLTHPKVQSWVTFPALWFFILYEQTYGDDPRVLQAHLRGVHDVIYSHGESILSLSTDGPCGPKDLPQHYRVPPQMIDRMTLWTIHYDAKASTFGLDGGIIDLLNERYPGSLTAMLETSKDALTVAWGSDYPAAEEIWDIQVEQLSKLSHDCVMLRFKLSKLECPGKAIDPGDLRMFGHELKQLEIEFSPFTSLALSRTLERSTLVSNTCAAVANFYALIVRYDRLVYEIQSPMVSSLLQICASLHEYEGDPFLWHVAWALFVVAFETDDPIHQSWILERFTHMQKSGKNMERARTLLQRLFLEKRRSRGVVHYTDWIRDRCFQQFSI